MQATHCFANKQKSQYFNIKANRNVCGHVHQSKTRCKNIQKTYKQEISVSYFKNYRFSNHKRLLGHFGKGLYRTVLSTKNILAAENIFGQCIGSIIGKSRRRKL